jgi:hypothetical protein
MIRDMIAKHRKNGVLIDTNLLLLLVVGIYDRRRIESFKRTSKYSVKDFQRVGGIANEFETLWTTPNIMTEVDNLGRQLESREWPNFSRALESLVLKMREEYKPTSELVTQAQYTRLGVADCAVLRLTTPFLLISDDLGLYMEAQRIGMDAVNYTHIRDF